MPAASPNLMNIWLTTDTHFGHKMLVEKNFRPSGFEYKIRDNLYKMAKPDDILIHLGDFCIGNDLDWHNFFNYPLRRWLITGNHDHKSNHWYLTHGWEFVGRMIVDKWCGKTVCLSHKPVADFGYDINIHGHFHDNAHRSSEPEFQDIVGPKHKLIALELTDYKPVYLETVIEKFFNVRVAQVAEPDIRNVEGGFSINPANPISEGGPMVGFK